MNRVKITIVSLLAVLSLCASAQEAEAGFTADRPGATNCTDVMPKGRVQWETGVAWERSKLTGPAATTWALNTSLLRWGFSDFAELRLQGSWLLESAAGDHDSGLADVAFGTKVRLFSPPDSGDWRRCLPEMALLTHILVPGGSDATFLPQHWGCQTGIIFQHQLASWCTLCYEAGLSWSDIPRPTLLFGVGASFAATKRLSVCVDEYNFNDAGGTECWSELSLAYQLTPRLQLDIASDFCLSYFADYHNVMLGVAWQITKK